VKAKKFSIKKEVKGKRRIKKSLHGTKKWISTSYIIVLSCWKFNLNDVHVFILLFDSFGPKSYISSHKKLAVKYTKEKEVKGHFSQKNK
jgi:hypothetical protein